MEDLEVESMGNLDASRIVRFRVHIKIYVQHNTSAMVEREAENS